MRRFILTTLALLLFTSVVHAVPQMPIIDWEASTDGGATWSANATIDHPQTIKIRARLRWAGDGIGVKYVNFDAWINGMNPQETPTNIVRTIIPSADTQRIVFSRLSESQGKIDVFGDSALPGNGAQWIRMGQDTPAILGQAFDSTNPVELFRFDFAVSPGIDWRTLEFGSVLSGTISNAVQIYTTQQGGTSRGAFNRSEVLMNACSVRYQPLADPPTITILQQPISQHVCFGRSATFTVVASTTTPPLRYEWRYSSNINVSIDGPSISSNGLWSPFPFWFAGGRFVCYLTDASGTIVSESADLLYNRADVDMNGWIDINDYQLFVNSFTEGDAEADLNQDGVVDLFDYLDFLHRHIAGC